MTQPKAILLIMPFFFKYEDKIRDALTKRNNFVFLINENIEETSLLLHCLYYFIYKVRGLSNLLKLHGISECLKNQILRMDYNYFYKKLNRLHKQCCDKKNKKYAKCCKCCSIQIEKNSEVNEVSRKSDEKGRSETIGKNCGFDKVLIIGQIRKLI